MKQRSRCSAAASLRGGAAAHQEGLHQAQLEEGAARLVVALRQVLAAGAAALHAAVAAPAAPGMQTPMNIVQSSIVSTVELPVSTAG
jgi:hypothetical protein